MNTSDSHDSQGIHPHDGTQRLRPRFPWEDDPRLRTRRWTRAGHERLRDSHVREKFLELTSGVAKAAKGLHVDQLEALLVRGDGLASLFDVGFEVLRRRLVGWADSPHTIMVGSA